MLIYVAILLLLASTALGNQGIICSNGICLPADYNKMDLPGIQPIQIDTQITLLEVYEVNEKDLTIHISLFMTFSWQDNRLNFTSSNATSADVDKHLIDNIWMPDVYIYNMKEMGGFNGVTTMRGLNVQKHGDSVKLHYSMEANVKFMCALSFHAFPFERNVCKFRLTSYTFTTDKIVFKAMTNRRPDGWLVKEKVRDYEVEVEYLEGNDTVQLDNLGHGSDAYYSVVGLKLTFKTMYFRYMWVYYLPTSMFTVTSWVSFLLPPTSYPARTSLLVTVFLCQIGLFNAVIRDTPKQDGGTNSIALSINTDMMIFGPHDFKTFHNFKTVSKIICLVRYDSIGELVLGDDRPGL